MAKPIILPAVEQPELAIPFIVGYRGYETARNINTLIESTEGKSNLRRRIPQPFISGSQNPAPRIPQVNPVSGGVQLPEQKVNYEDVIERIRNSLGEMREETKDYGSSSATVNPPIQQQGTSDIDYQATIDRMQRGFRQTQIVNDNLGILRDRRRVNIIRNLIERKQLVGRDPAPTPPPEGPEVDIGFPEDYVDIFHEPSMESKLINSDTQLEDEDIGFEPPNPYVNRPRTIPNSLRFPPIVQNPKFDLPRPANPNIPTYTGIEPSTPMEILPPDPNDPYNDPTITPSLPTMPPKENIVYNSEPPPSTSMKTECSNNDINMFPIFASGMALTAIILAIPLITK